MSHEPDNSLPNEEPTQSLNRLVGEVRAMDLRLSNVETAIESLSWQTNANLLAAFAEILHRELEPIKAAQARMEETQEKMLERLTIIENDLCDVRRMLVSSVSVMGREQYKLEQRVIKLESHLTQP